MPGELSSSLKQAVAAIADDVTTITAELAQMIAADTSFPPGAGYGDFADLMEGLLAPAGFSFQRVSVPEHLWQAAGGRAHGERVNLIARRRTGRPVCSLYYHVDTVPAGSGWTFPPFALTPAGNRLHGRGAADMKGAIAATLAALRAAAAHGVALRFDPEFLLCTDEEGGLYPGVRYLAEQGLVKGHILSFNGSAGPRIWAGCFGSIDLLVTVRGRGAHSGDPVGGINAIEVAMPLLNALMALKRRVEQRVSTMPPPPHNEGRPLHARLTLAALHGGDKGSALPERLEILINRRYSPEEDFAAVRAEIDETIAGAMAGSAALEVSTQMIGHLAPVADPTGPHWPRWQAALGHAFGYAPEEFRVWGSSTSSDMGFVQAAGVREILLGGLTRPGNNTHAPDEFTTVDDLVALAQAVLLYLAQDFGAA